MIAASMCVRQKPASKRCHPRSRKVETSAMPVFRLVSQPEAGPIHGPPARRPPSRAGRLPRWKLQIDERASILLCNQYPTMPGNDQTTSKGRRNLTTAATHAQTVMLALFPPAVWGRKRRVKGVGYFLVVWAGCPLDAQQWTAMGGPSVP